MPLFSFYSLTYEMGKLRFIVQEINGEIVHDFVFELLRSIEYQRWRGEDVQLRATSLEKLELHGDKEFTPVGTIEFVREFIRKVLGYTGPDPLVPINVPQALCKEDVFTGTGEEIKAKFRGGHAFYVKSMTELKSSLNGPYSGADVDRLEDSGLYQVRPLRNILSEWRVMVRSGQVLGCHNYSGDPLVFPDREVIEKMIQDYKNCPPEYSMDVMVTEETGTECLEVHEFYSLGLYGFSNYATLPFLFNRAFYRIKQRLV